MQFTQHMGTQAQKRNCQEKKAVSFHLTPYLMQRTTSSLLQTFIKQEGLVVVCKENNSISGNRDRRLASRPESKNSYSFLAWAVIDPQLLHILKARSAHRLTFSNTRPVCQLQPVCLVNPGHMVRIFSLSVLLNTRKSRRQKKN